MAVKRLGRPWKGVKARRCVWDGESDHWLSPLSTKPSQNLIDVQDEIMGGESVMSFVPCDLTGLSCSTPGFTPGSLPVLLPIPGPPQSHSITLL